MTKNKTTILGVTKSLSKLGSLLPLETQQQLKKLLSLPGTVLIKDDLIWLERMLTELSYIDDSYDRDEWVLEIDEQIRELLESLTTKKEAVGKQVSLASLQQPITILAETDEKQQEKFLDTNLCFETWVAHYLDNLEISRKVCDRLTDGMTQDNPPVHEWTPSVFISHCSNDVVRHDVDYWWPRILSHPTTTQKYHAQVSAKGEVFYEVHSETLPTIVNEVADQLIVLDCRGVSFANVLITEENKDQAVFYLSDRPSTVFCQLDDQLKERTELALFEEVKPKLISMYASQMSRRRQRFRG